MSGALISLVATGAQDVYVKGDMSLFTAHFTRCRNFSQAPQKLDFTSGRVRNNEICSVKIHSHGDLINYMWLEGTNLVENLSGTVFELYIGGQLIDSQTYDYMADIWQIYLAETQSKSATINNAVSHSNTNFFPLHFFFCDHGLFLPLVALQYHEVEIRITWGSTIESASDVKVYGNYVYLDTEEREEMVRTPMELLVTQVQRLSYTPNETSLDITSLNHPVKCIFFGFEATDDNYITNYFTFTGADIYVNGTMLVENMSPTYYHTVQGYHHTSHGNINFQVAPMYTRYYMYSFAMNASKYEPTGTCNFSRLDNAKITMKGVTKVSSASYKVYAVGYNILRVRDGMAGILFSN